MPQAWVISLAQRPDRLAAFRARAAAAGLDVAEFIVERATTAREGWGGSPESCGNALAHERILLGGARPDGTYDPLLVFEDDAMIPPNLSGYVHLALERMPPAWELCLLGAGSIVADLYNAHLGPVRISSFSLTHAYLVSGRGRVALARCAAAANHHWDDLASRRMCGRGQVYGYLPTIAAQDLALGSDIPDSWTSRAPS